MYRRRIIIKSIASFVIGYIIVMIGQVNWFASLQEAYIYKDLLITWISVFIVFEYTDRVTLALDRKYPWRDHVLLRTMLQTVLVVILPALFAILLTYIQWEFIYRQDMVEHGYFAFEFPVTILLIIIVNLFFVVLNLAKTPGDEGISGRPAGVKTVLGRKGRRNVPVEVSEIACIVLKNGILFLTTFDDQEMSIPDTLDHYDSILPQDRFFRINRQIIVSRKACQSFKPVEHGKIEVSLRPPLREPVIVSQRKAAKFRAWIAN